MTEIDETRWSGDMPLPDWWDDSADAAAQCEAAVLDRHGLHQVCTRPDGHAGRHLTAFAVFAGHPAVIACAWPGEHEPVASDLDDQAVLCRCDCDCHACAATVRDDRRLTGQSAPRGPMVQVTARTSRDPSGNTGVEATATITDGQVTAVGTAWCQWDFTVPSSPQRDRAGYVEAARRATEKATEQARWVLAGIRAGGAS